MNCTGGVMQGFGMAGSGVALRLHEFKDSQDTKNIQHCVSLKLFESLTPDISK